MHRQPRAPGAGAVTQRLVFIILVAAAGILCTCGAFALYGPMINNGDFLRVSTDHLPLVRLWKPLATCEPMVSGNTLRAAFPESTMSLFFNILVFAHRLARESCISQSAMFVFLSVVFWLGVVAFAAAAASGSTFCARGVASCVLAYVILAYYFKSLYEEAAVLALMPWLLTGLALRAKLPGAMLLAVASALILYAKSELIFVLPVLAATFARSPSAQRLGRGRLAALLLVFFILPAAVQVAKAALTHLGTSKNCCFSGIVERFGRRR